MLREKFAYKGICVGSIESKWVEDVELLNCPTFFSFLLHKKIVLKKLMPINNFRAEKCTNETDAKKWLLFQLIRDLENNLYIFGGLSVK